MQNILSGDESRFPVFNWRGKPTFHKQLKRSFPSGIFIWEGRCVFCFKWNGPRDALTRKKTRFSCRGLTAFSSFVSQDERVSKSPLETLLKALGLHLIWTMDLTTLWHLDRFAESSASKVDDACLFLNIVRNPNITVPNWKLPLVSCLTSRSVCIVLPSLV